MSSQRSRQSPGSRRTEGHGGTVKVNRVYAEPERRTVPRLNVKGVPCPTCKAEVGAPCVTLTTGVTSRTPHPVRSRMAARVRNELIAAGEAQVAVPQPKTPLLDEDGSVCPVCGSRVPLRNAMFSDRERGVRVKDRVLARHTQDGGSVRGTNPACPGSEGLPA